MILATAAQMKELDRRTIEELGIPGLVLMENAARSAVQVIAHHYPRMHSPAVFCGKGNNGGDGLAMARYFHQQGLDVRVVLAGSRKTLKGDAAHQFRIIEKSGVPFIEMDEKADWAFLKLEVSRSDLLVDALLGTGLEKEVQGFFKDLIALMNELPIPKVALDLPSGLSSDTGQPLGICLQADLTVTFGLPKVGQVLLPGCRFLGRLFVADIGLSPLFFPAPENRVELLEASQLASCLPQRDPGGHKSSYGHVLILAGSQGKTGAAALACLGALRAGAGLVTLGIPESLNAIMEVKLTEAMTEPLPEGTRGTLGFKALGRIVALLQGKKALAIGPGLSTAPQTKRLMQTLTKETSLPLVIDADALNALSEAPKVLKHLAGRAILTPHPGEMSRLSGKPVAEIQADRIKAAREFAQRHQLILVLKGAGTVIADPEGPVYLNPVAHSVLAAGGTGDVLTGVILGLLSQGLSLKEAACLGVYLHGRAGVLLAARRGAQGLLASELPEEIPGLLSQKDLWTPLQKEAIPLIREVKFG